jgi:hypothetical protein
MDLSNIRNIALTTYLKSIGFEPKHQVRNRLFYHSPFRPNEKTPSFAVRPKENDFIDFADRKGGDIIKFVERYHGIGFKEAVRLLQGFDGSIVTTSFSFVCHTDNEPVFNLKKVKRLENKALLQYLSERKINKAIAQIYLKEAYYNTKSFALAFENDLGGYELRNKIWKGSTSPKTITTIKGESNKGVLLFEGFMDFLSYLTMIQNQTPKYDTIVLNSVNNIEAIKDLIPNYGILYSVLDTDPKGKEAFRTLTNEYPNQKIIDCSIRYDNIENVKDLNDYLVKKHFNSS